MDLSIIIPVINERENISSLLPIIKDQLNRLGITYEILVVDGGSSDGTSECAKNLGARVLHQQNKGYGEALKVGFREGTGDYILTMDADLSHYPGFIRRMWRHRDRAEIIIASRYVRGGVMHMPFLRKLLSRTLNLLFRAGLSLPINDLSSGFRLYKSGAIKALKEIESKNFEILEELLIKIYMQGFSIKEVPFTYYPRIKGSSHARVFAFGVCMLRTFFKMWKVRNSIESADYDERAFHSRILPQRYWQRKRHSIIVSMARSYNRILDIGCGSSMILLALNNAVGLDIALGKLRYMRRYGCDLINGDIFKMPFKEASFECVVCSEVIEHLRCEANIFMELKRILKPEGILILGTPDYGTIGWRIIEPLYGLFLPGGYKDGYITHYTRRPLERRLREYGFKVEDARYILQSELILKCRKSH